MSTMKITENKYYVNKLLNVKLSEKTLTDSYKMKEPDYRKKEIQYTVYSEGFFNLSKKPYSKDIVETLYDSTTIYDLHIIDLFQLADSTMNRLYTTAESKDESLKINYGFDSELKIHNPIANETFRYPVVSVRTATIAANKIFRLHKVLKGF